jgi:hypothetical protein
VGERRTEADRSQTRRRFTVPEAAEVLGVTIEAVRGRIKRDTLAHEKGEDGTVYVLLNADQSQSTHDQSTAQTLIVERLENEVRFLREEVTRKDAILLNMTEVMKAISPPTQEEAPERPPETPVSATEQPGRVGPQTPLEGPMAEPVERRPWWSRIFGGISSPG